jgi:ATP sulfurylase
MIRYIEKEPNIGGKHHGKYGFWDYYDPASARNLLANIKYLNLFIKTIDFDHG